MNKYLKHTIFLGLSLFAVSCVPDSVDGDGNGLTPTNSDASFTVTKTSENHYKLASSNNNYISSKWNLDDGGGFGTGPNTYDIFIPDEGTYNIQHQIIGQGGLVGGTASQTIKVDKADPAAGNMILGGKFTDAADVAKWSMAFPNPSGTALWTFADGKATFVAKGWERNVLYQAVNVVEGRTYKADAVVSSKGVSDTWFEIYVGYAKPTANNDYTGDGNDSTWLRGINTWAGSGTSAFTGKISIVGSVNSNNPNGTFKATKTGVAYFAIRSGGNDMKEGISITNVEFRGIN
ncbi:hypothetical protein [Epilithonimonas sp. UC225_85]|uniref:hypothetical protein n=1 Tax=Epilithonimonas sp. UC225_85 TaxID=3350167 RepID=UPI0036D23CFA